MKHLDVIGGELTAVPSEQRPANSVVGQHVAIIILQMRMQDAETWAAYTATLDTLQLSNDMFREYILHVNGLNLQTPCNFSFGEEFMSYADNQLLAQLKMEQISYTDSSVIHVAKVSIPQSCDSIAQFLSAT